MKKLYEELEVELVRFTAEDVLTTSAVDCKSDGGCKDDGTCGEQCDDCDFCNGDGCGCVEACVCHDDGDCEVDCANDCGGDCFNDCGGVCGGYGYDY